jgi:outer membrane protein OmpA-like peptidoglycan-associated protein
MGDGALKASSGDNGAVARGRSRDTAQNAGPYGDSPAIRLLDAMGAGDDLGILSVCGETTTVSAENMSWSSRGREEIHQMLVRTRERFPGLTFESSTRHVGFGLVIDEARVTDEQFVAPAPDDTEVPDEPVVADPSVHPMWDEPVTEKRNVMSVWGRHAGRAEPPVQLNMPVRVTVRHDDLQVHEVVLSFPAALLKRALGMPVDPLEMSLSEIQSAFIAPVGAGFTTYTLARPELSLVPPPPPEPEPNFFAEPPPPRRRGRVLVPVLILLAALIGGGAWYAVLGNGGSPSADSTLTSTPPSPTHTATPAPTTSPSSSKAPKVTHGAPSNAPSRKPNITLKSDLAFGFNSAQLSAKAKSAIDGVAQQVVSAGLSGKIYVEGYTDNLGSAAYGMVLSRRRADAVSHYLGSQLVGAPVAIVSIGHGEADPVASNATAAGRQANRRVTITLPKP